MDPFHPAVARWFGRVFPGGPTAAQRAAWPAIAAGRNTLVAAPTGSGKTLTAFLTAIDALVRRALGPGGLSDETTVVYVSPLKALSNDIHLNLEAPLAGIRGELAALGLPVVDIRAAVRTGDTPQRERTIARRSPPHVLVTTPESLYVLLGSESGRAMLRTTRTVIVDEIHSVAASRRGSHLALSLERLERLVQAEHGRRLQRIGLSATQKPIDEVARFLVGSAAVSDDGRADCAIVDIGHVRRRDLALVVPPTALSAVMSNDQWEQVYDQLAALACAHRTTLVFVNTRRMAERAARHLADRLGEEKVAAHHGSLAREKRFDAERRLKNGELQVLVATASLELGLDIGEVELVCQLGSPRSISTFLQRAGRSGHSAGGLPKARLFPGTRDELVECAALLDCVRRGELDALRIPAAPLDVLAQQIVAEVACGECDEDELYETVRKAWPYAGLARPDFSAVVRMLSEGFATRDGTRSARLHRDAVNRRLRARRGARLVALTCGGTIPDTGDYAVVLEPDALAVGTVNEDFAVESLAGDVFQLGNVSYRIRRIEPGRVRVEDARGAPPSIPFWLGEAPGRSDELSQGVSRLRVEIERRLACDGREAGAWLVADVGLDEASASQIVDYLHRSRAGLGALPTQQRIVLERFLDESGGAQLVVHSPFGSRINRAWGLALRKRFCRRFNFELQAAATEDAIVLSLSTSHSFALADVARYLHSGSALDVLVQALLTAPMFGARWRWNATTALALPRFAGGRKVAAPLQRMKSEDLLAAVFPDQVACAENLSGEREVPDHPLVAQTLDDCLNDAMDAPGWLRLLRSIESGDVEVVARDLVEPSPLASEAIAACVYAFLDDAPLEERRTQAVRNRRHLDPDGAGDLGRLDAGAIEAVRREARPQARNADELHEALAGIVAMSAGEAQRDGEWAGRLGELVHARRATRLAVPQESGTRTLWVAAERLPLLRAVFPQARPDPAIEAPAEYAQRHWRREDAVRELVRGRLGAHGPVTAAQLASPIALTLGDVEPALVALEQEGSAVRGRFTPDADDDQWCERHLLARIHRFTLQQLRREIEPVEPRDFARFLFEWQHLAPASRVSGAQALAAILAQLEGFEAPASAWEGAILSARVEDYELAWLDELCTTGRLAWMRLRPPALDEGRAPAGASLRAAPVLLLPRASVATWTRLAPAPHADAAASARARRVLRHLEAHGASFFDEIAEGTRLLRSELEDALSELVAHGRVRCDSYAGLRALLVPPSRRAGTSPRRRRNAALSGIEDAGRWTLAGRAQAEAGRPDDVEHVARTLLRRYGVVCWRLLEREAPWLPPWRELVRVYQRLEARGEIRGGRFVAGVAGEQFALPEAIAPLRRARRRVSESPEWVCVAAADPSNLLGSLLPGARLPRIGGARVLYRDGVPVATLLAERIEWLQPPRADERADAMQRLLGRPSPPRLGEARSSAVSGAEDGAGDGGSCGTPLAAHFASSTCRGKPR